MGVRHLFTFISKSVHNGLFPVNMDRDIQSYKRINRSNKDQMPTIIVDLLALHSHVYLNDHEVLLGGRYDIYNERARFMFSQLKSLGVNILFFVDGPAQEDKLNTCLERRNENYKNGVRILHAIDDGLDLSGDLSSYKLVNLSTFFRNFKDIAKEYGELHISILNECGQEMVTLAAARGALAIITDDTDFLIFEGKWRVWSGNNLDFKTLTTMQYNKEALRATLELTPQQMVLLASLGGNDIVKYETVEEFHHRISNRTNKFRAIANFIRKLNTFLPNLNYLDKNTLANSVFHPDDRDEGMLALQKSINFYCLDDMQVEHKNILLERLAREVKHFSYTILGNKKYISTFIYCDLLKKVFTPYYEVIKPLFCRIMGVLLQNEANEDVSRTFYFKLDHDKLFEPVKLFPEYPPCKVPSAVELLYHPYGEDPTLDELRWNLLCFIISQKLNSNLLREIPKENLGTVLTLFHLVELKEISVDEADCVLLSCNPTPEILNGLDFNEVKQINGRDARMAFLYAQLHNLMDNCIRAVGLGEYSTLLKFDGLCFHTLRKRWISDGEQLKRAMMKPLKCLRIYSEDFKIL